ncbi:hypothetical protein VTL71DRAFT_2005 [Oculimacula yallundae]|uniref:Uncharacterized protein n=1 Tax=Oculimacula yallundae TaxID=86028 RepID=A0ABR4CCC7_9HELO
MPSIKSLLTFTLLMPAILASPVSLQVRDGSEVAPAQEVSARQNTPGQGPGNGRPSPDQGPGNNQPGPANGTSNGQPGRPKGAGNGQPPANQGPNNGQQPPNQRPNNGQQTPNKGPGNGPNPQNQGPNNGQQPPNQRPNNGQQTPNQGPNNGQQTPNKGPGNGPNPQNQGPNNGQQPPNQSPGSNGQQNAAQGTGNGQTACSANTNALVSGINANIALQKQEQAQLAVVQRMVDAGNVDQQQFGTEKNKFVGIVNAGIDQRQKNQALAQGGNPASAGLAMVANAQATELKTVQGLTGNAATDDPAFAALAPMFAGGIAQNQKNAKALQTGQDSNGNSKRVIGGEKPFALSCRTAFELVL